MPSISDEMGQCGRPGTSPSACTGDVQADFRSLALDRPSEQGKGTSDEHITAADFRHERETFTSSDTRQTANLAVQLNESLEMVLKDPDRIRGRNDDASWSQAVNEDDDDEEEMRLRAEEAQLNKEIEEIRHHLLLRAHKLKTEKNNRFKHVQTIAKLKEDVESLEEQEREAEAQYREGLARSSSWWNPGRSLFGSTAEPEAERRERDETRAERARVIEINNIQIEHHANALSHLDDSLTKTRQRVRELKATQRGLLARKGQILRARKGTGAGGRKRRRSEGGGGGRG
ncbi:hypothetical protein M409DRAFT_55546 [Zasmidium cellare ATCC 36951]|uniref:Uncharacterized protein n=1 Tax=Zasmidium cellare ATCC 36951 TaxID=1080233 RepID=A0A6A6CJQ2_ZASCE|nr:uncharacterized protein M409DRAFT_55546 [Zasmidium cellare ATCC 36951]KAF2165656.1 hypothetical protein M409DRAFT_55546 [Zasmidium cellare ATCC 36951]